MTSSETGRVFIVAATGWIGGRLATARAGCIGVGSRDLLANPRHLDEIGLRAGDVVVNAAGCKSGEYLWEVNVDLVRSLIASCEHSGARLVHLGSAAEYGIDQPGLPLSEDTPTRPTSDYGRSKLVATTAVLESYRGVVLRVFNVVAGPPQATSPLEDVVRRCREAASRGHPPSLFSAETERDWISLAFVLRSITTAVDLPISGLFNICSGTAVSMRAIAGSVMQALGGPSTVIDEERSAPTAVVGDPTRWRERTGLSESLSAVEIASIACGEG